MARLEVLLSVAPRHLSGGVAMVCPLLVAHVRKYVDVKEFFYGRKNESETIIEKVWGRLGDLWRAWRLMRSYRPDCIHHNTAFDRRAIMRDWALLVVAQQAGIRVFVLFHGVASDSFKRSVGILGLCRWITLKLARRIGVQSAIQAQQLQRAFPYTQGRVSVVKNIIANRFLQSTRDPSPEPTVLFVSRLIRAKGPFDVLYAVNLVLRSIPSARFLFAGDGPDSSEFDKEVLRLSLGRAVVRLGHVPNEQTTSLYKRAWVFVFPSHFPEGMPLAIGEALGSGMPIIATPIDFVQSFLREGENYLGVPVGDVEAIAERVVLLLSDSDLRRRMSCANRRVAAQFQGDLVAKEFLSVYESTVTT